MEQALPYRRRSLLNLIPGWLMSLLLHTLFILVMALVTFADPNKVTSILTMSGPEENAGESDIQQFDIQDASTPESQASDEMVEPTSEIPPPIAAMASVEVLRAVEVSTLTSADFAMPSLSTDTLNKSFTQPTKTLSSRSTDMKKELLRRYGGTDATESAVSNALHWLSQHQAPNGSWTFEHSTICGKKCGDPGVLEIAPNAATALAILPFLGAGQTHLHGQYKEVVGAGVRFLIKNMKLEGQGGFIRGSLMDQGSPGHMQGNMYSHGLASIALCEAYAMTEDPDIGRAAQAAINHIVYAQDPRGGGWRYVPKQQGDTSVVGWQVMALKSGYMGKLQIPEPTFRGAVRFLDFVSTSKGAYYGYDKASTSDRPACTAIGLLCRMYMGWDREHPGISKGVSYLAKRGLDKKDIYYDYYAAQVLRHYGGPEWDAFNKKLQEWLVSTQETSGHPKGSWYFPDSHSHRGPIEGGRLASTSFATMILEVYYRHMPLYADSAAKDDFSL
jgi:hypothetical protein